MFVRHKVCLLYRWWIKPEMRCLCKLIIWICKPVRSNLSSCERTLQRVISLRLQSRAIPQRWCMQHLDGVISAAHTRKDLCSCKVLTVYQASWSANIEHLHTVKPDVILFSRAHPPLPPPQKTSVSKQVIKWAVYTRGRGFRGQCFPSMCIRQSLQG